MVKNKMLILNDVLGYKNRKIYQDNNYFKFCIDGVLLANFVDIKLATKKIVDIGTGTGIIPLILSLKTNVKIDALEIQEEICDIFRKTILYNKLADQINLVNADINLYSKKVENLNKYDIVISNPPYYKEVNYNTVKSIARHENFLKLEDLIKSSNRILKDKASLYLVYDTKRITEVFSLLNKYNFSIKKLQFVHDNSEKGASIFLVEALKNGKTTVKVLPPFILFEKNGIMTEMYQKIYHGSE